MFLLDTNAVIAVLNERPAAGASRLDAEIGRGAALYLSAIVLYELHYGFARSDRVAGNQAVLLQFLSGPVTPVAFEPEDAEHAGDIRTHLKRQSTLIGPYDILIAAQARRRGLTRVTTNGREFARVPGLICDDWMM